VLVEDGILHLVCYKPCMVVRRKLITMALKWDTISKYGSHELHKKCLDLYATRGFATVAKQI